MREQRLGELVGQPVPVLSELDHPDTHSREGERPWSAWGTAVLYLVADGEILGALALADEARPESRAALDAQQGPDIHVVMITGDAWPVAEAVGRELGVRRGVRRGAAWATGCSLISMPLAAGVLAGVGIVLVSALERS